MRELEGPRQLAGHGRERPRARLRPVARRDVAGDSQVDGAAIRAVPNRDGPTLHPARGAAEPDDPELQGTRLPPADALVEVAEAPSVLGRHQGLDRSTQDVGLGVGLQQGQAGGVDLQEGPVRGHEFHALGLGVDDGPEALLLLAERPGEPLRLPPPALALAQEPRVFHGERGLGRQRLEERQGAGQRRSRRAVQDLQDAQHLAVQGEGDREHGAVAELAGHGTVPPVGVGQEVRTDQGPALPHHRPRERGADVEAAAGDHRLVETGPARDHQLLPLPEQEERGLGVHGPAGLLDDPGQQGVHGVPRVPACMPPSLAWPGGQGKRAV